jgi:hypothetical protein
MKIRTEDISILKSFGYTGREAGFLYLVAIYSGYFTQRQFTEFGSMKPEGCCGHSGTALETEYDTSIYEKKISLLMAQAYRRIKRENAEKLRLWDNAFRVLSKGDHYILLFWRQNKFRKSPRTWPTFVLGALAVASLSLLVYLFFGNRGQMRHGEPAPLDKYIPSLSPMAQHSLQALFVLTFLFAVFPSYLPNWLVCSVGS